FDGFDLQPDLEITDVGATTVKLALTHHRIRVVGADAATVLGPFGLRGEAAYTFTEHSENGQVKSPFFLLVLGGDRTFLQSLNVNVQYILRVISDFRKPTTIEDPLRRRIAIEQAEINDQLDQIQHSISLRVSKKWLNETLEAEVGSIIALTRFSY